MGAALSIAAKDLRQKLRDRSAIILTVVAPFALAATFSLMIPATDTFKARYAIVNLDGGPVAQALVDGPLAGLSAAGVTLRTVPDAEAARKAVQDGTDDAAIIIPAGFSAAVQSGGASSLQVIGSANRTLATQVAVSVIESFASSVEAVQLSVATVLATGGTAGADPAALARAAQALPDPIAFQVDSAADRLASSSTYYAASMAVLFVFFAAQFGVVSLLAERRAGTLARMLAAPISSRTVLLGKLLVSIVLGALSMAVIAAGTTLLLGARWGDPIAVAALILAIALASSGIALVIVGFTRTEDQASGLTGIVAMTLAILGGSFFPLSQAPEILARVSLLTPHAWFLRGINDLASGGGIPVVLPSITVLGILGLAACGIGLLRAGRAVIPR